MRNPISHCIAVDYDIIRIHVLIPHQYIEHATKYYRYSEWNYLTHIIQSRPKKKTCPSIIDTYQAHIYCCQQGSFIIF